jgi:hypothetical protein
MSYWFFYRVIGGCYWVIRVVTGVVIEVVTGLVIGVVTEVMALYPGYKGYNRVTGIVTELLGYYWVIGVVTDLLGSLQAYWGS